MFVGHGPVSAAAHPERAVKPEDVITCNLVDVGFPDRPKEFL
jgi:hypothetical protein